MSSPRVWPDSHVCPVNGCERVVPNHLLMCREDWSRVHRTLQGRVYRAYRRGAGVGSRELADAQAAAIADANRARLEVGA